VRRDGSATELGEFISGGGANAEQNVGDAEMRTVFLERVREFAKGLDERDGRILHERILSEEPRTLQELGEDFGVTRERVRQLEARLVARLSEYLKANLVDFEFYASPRD
jgi:RNA polymerase sigma-32 factor